MKQTKKAKPRQWKALIAVDRTTGEYLAGYIPAGGRPMAEFRAGIKVYRDPVVRHGLLTLLQPKRKAGK